MAKKYDLFLRNYVGGYDFDSDYVVYFLNKNRGKEVSVLIDSRGGSLAAGISISTAFRDHGNVHAHFSSLNASAATIASLGAARISMASDAFYLVHKASVPVFEWTSMNADQIEERCRKLEKQKAELAKFDVAIAKAYAKRCRKKPEDMLALMEKETWLSADEALEWGFIDEITDFADDPKTEITDEIIADFAALGISIPAQIAKKSIKDRFLDRIFNIFNSSIMDPEKKNQTPGNNPGANPGANPGNNSGANHGAAASAEKTDSKDLSPENAGPSNADILARIEAIEKRLANHDGRNPNDALPEDAADPLSEQTPLQVVNTGKSNADDSSFADSVKSASELFNSLP